jgi:hypothetical protein
LIESADEFVALNGSADPQERHRAAQDRSHDRLTLVWLVLMGLLGRSLVITGKGIHVMEWKGRARLATLRRLVCLTTL